MIRAAFCGTPAAAVPALAALAGVAEVALVVTRPDRPRGRSGAPAAPAVKLAAAEWGLPVAQPGSHGELDAALDGAGNLDVAVVVAYGRILRPATLARTRTGFVNVHFSLLPRWRGAAPVEHAIRAGDPVTGVSLMLLDEGLDTGPVLGAMETPIGRTDTGGSLTARLATEGARLLAALLPGHVTGAVKPAAQPTAGVTHAPRLQPADSRISSDQSAEEVQRAVRAFHPRPGAWANLDGERVKVMAAGPAPEELEMGAVELRDGRVIAGFSGGAVELLRVQPAGKRPMAAVAWMHGRRGQPARLS